MADKPILEILRETRDDIRNGAVTLDDAAAWIGSRPEIGLTATGARNLLSRSTQEVEHMYRDALGQDKRTRHAR